MPRHDLIVLGGGPAGLTAALYGRRAGLDVLVVEMNVCGGQMRLTSNVENWPGSALISGEELSEKMREQAASFGVQFLGAQVEGLQVGPPPSKGPAGAGGPKIVKTSEGDLEAYAVVVATGAVHRSLECPGAEKFNGRGVSFCAVCDAGFFRGQEVAVVGGGNAALEQAMYLTGYCAKVSLVHRRDQFRADGLIQRRLADFPQITPVMSSVVTAIEGTDEVELLRLRRVDTGAESELPVTGVFVFVGVAPNSGFLPPEVKRTEGGWVICDEHLETSCRGVYAAGDVRDTDLRQIVSAAGDGARAAMNAYRQIQGLTA
ncbi:MAG: FAD-dependent oxidoreductase [Deltaproteobacteria bacterium]|nr:FAD-dependent oxidoreductase [Deltaproteobacteria bacterium]